MNTRNTVLIQPNQIDLALDCFKKDKKNNQHIRTFTDFIHLFKPLSLLRKHKTINEFRYLIDELSILQVAANEVFYRKEELTQNMVWFLVSGKIELKIEYDVMGEKTVEVVLINAFQSFGHENKIFLRTEQIILEEMHTKYEAKCIQPSILFKIASSKLHQYLNFNEFSSEIAKRNFICEALNIQDDQEIFTRGFTKKFFIKPFQKNSIIFTEKDFVDEFMIVKKGDVELFKDCDITDDKKLTNIKLGILTPGTFINDYRIGHTIQFSAKAISYVQIMTITKYELIKSFTQIPKLEINLKRICDLQSSIRIKIIDKYREKPRYLSEVEDKNNYEISIPLFKKNGLSFRNQKSTVTYDFLGLQQYQQIVENQAKIFAPLNKSKPIRNNSNTITNRKYKKSQLKKMLKKQKMDKIRVKKLAQKRIHGFEQNHIIVELKPTIFKQKIIAADMEKQNYSINGDMEDKKILTKHITNNNTCNNITISNDDSNIHTIMNKNNTNMTPTASSPNQKSSNDYNPFNLIDTGLINSLSKNTLNYKKNILCLKEGRGKATNSTEKVILDSTSLVKQRMKQKYEYKFIHPPRYSYQVDLNRAFDSLILTQSRTGKIRKLRVHIN